MNLVQHLAQDNVQYGHSGTSALGAMRESRPPAPTARIGVLYTGNTLPEEAPDYRLSDLGTSAGGSQWILLDVSSPRGGSEPAVEEPQTDEVARTAVTELRRLSGLTWEQLAPLFGVSRRSVHLWASGKPLKAAHGKKLYRLLELLKYLDRGNADENRRLLLTPLKQGESPVELLAAGGLEEVRRLLDPGAGSKTKHAQLAADAWEARLPPRPEQLVNALQDSVHRESASVRSARSKKITKGTKG